MHPRTLTVLACVGVAGLWLGSSPFRSSTHAPDAMVDVQEPEATRPRDDTHAAGAEAPDPRGSARRRASLLRVSVRDGRRPIRNAAVTVRTPDRAYDGTTNGRGRVALALHTTGRLSVYAEADGYAPWLGQAEVDDSGGKLAITLKRSARVKGHVTGWTGQERDVQVLAVAVDDETRLHPAAISARGEFHLARLEPGAYRLKLDPAELTVAPVEVYLEPGQEAEVALALRATGRLDLTAIFPAGDQPTRGASLRLVDQADRSDTLRRLTLTSGETAAVDTLRPGTHFALLEVAGLARLPAQTISVSAGRASAVTFAWPRGTVRGTVSTDDGTTVGGVAIIFKVVTRDDGRDVREANPTAGVQLPADGAYRFDGLAAGRYVLVARAGDRWRTTPVSLADDEARTVDLHLAGGSTVETRVYHAGRPVAGANVQLAENALATFGTSGRTDVTGSARIGPLSEGDYAVRATWYARADGPLLEANAVVRVDGGGTVPVVLSLD